MWGAAAGVAAGVAASAALEAPDAAARRGTVHRCLASNRGAKLWTSAAHHNRTRGIATTLCGHKYDRYQLALLMHCSAASGT